jgi:hypothetical protein
MPRAPKKGQPIDESTKNIYLYAAQGNGELAAQAAAANGWKDYSKKGQAAQSQQKPAPQQGAPQQSAPQKQPVQNPTVSKAASDYLSTLGQ